ncbi:MAG TPA: citryl-CoA lyase [Amycolatopsis sp.]|jgi:citrate synthase|nr:citryl-CoA lyase [Amycolatopsis sp.]
MRIGKTADASSSIATADPDTITVRDRDLCAELIGQIGFTEYFLMLLTGTAPDPARRALVDACLVAIAEHGLVPSVAAARMTLAAAPEAWQGAVAAGLLGCGSVVLGSAQDAGTLLRAGLSDVDAGEPVEQVAEALVARARAERAALPGFGHPLHRDEDPRSTALLALADDLGTAGGHVRLLRAIEAAVPAHYGRRLPVNVSGAIAAVLLDAGFPAAALKAVSLLARTAGLLAHLLEETDRPIGFLLAESGAEAVEYRPATVHTGH